MNCFFKFKANLQVFLKSCQAAKEHCDISSDIFIFVYVIDFCYTV